MTRPLLSLVMIVANEADNIRATLASVLPFVDHGTIVDTGSTDGTQDVVIDAFKAANKKLHLHSEPFVDYASTRNRALDLDKVWDDETRDTESAVFTLTLSADETLHGGDQLRAFLELNRDASDGAYCVTMQTDTRLWPFTRVLRTDAGWRYVGEVHERPVSPAGEVMGAIIPGVNVTHTESDPTRKRKRLREYDLPLLTRIVEDESKSLSERAHAIYFLAETHMVLAEDFPRTPGSARTSHHYAAMALYHRYAKIAERGDEEAQDIDKALYAYTMFYHAAEHEEIFTHRDFVARLAALCEVSLVPEAHFMLAKHAMFIDPKKALPLALKAADVARQVRADPSHVPTDTRMEWLSYKLAAECAEQLKDSKRAVEMMEKAIAAGAPKSEFNVVVKKR